jgi:hypothetical protein
MMIVAGWLLLAAWQNAGKGRVLMTITGLVLAFVFARVA